MNADDFPHCPICGRKNLDCARILTMLGDNTITCLECKGIGYSIDPKRLIWYWGQSWDTVNLLLRDDNEKEV